MLVQPVGCPLPSGGPTRLPPPAIHCRKVRERALVLALGKRNSSIIGCSAVTTSGSSQDDAPIWHACNAPERLWHACWTGWLCVECGTHWTVRLLRPVWESESRQQSILRYLRSPWPFQQSVTRARAASDAANPAGIKCCHLCAGCRSLCRQYRRRGRGRGRCCRSEEEKSYHHHHHCCHYHCCIIIGVVMGVTNLEEQWRADSGEQTRNRG